MMQAKNHIQHVLAALCVCVIVIFFLTFRSNYRAPEKDALIYTEIAYQLVENQIFTNGNGQPQAGMFFAPLYPFFVASIASFDSKIKTTLVCVHDKKSSCDYSGFKSLILTQAFLAALSVACIFCAVLYITGNTTTAWVSTVTVLASGVFSKYASQYLTESLTFFLLLFWLVRWIKLIGTTTLMKREFFLQGMVLGLVTLSRPSYMYLAYLAFGLLLCWLLFIRKEDIRRAGMISSVWVAGIGLVLTPWIIRNYVMFDRAALVEGYGPFILVQRLAYNLMTWKEWAVSFIYWLPDFGDSLAKYWFNEADYSRLSWGENSFYALGNGAYARDMAAQAQGKEYLGFLLKDVLWNNIGKHIAVTITLALRGMWTGGYIGLAGFLCLFPCFYILKNQGRALGFIFYSIPLFFMLGAHAFVSVNVVRYNEPLIAVFALSFAVVVVHRLSRRKNAE